MNLLRVSPRFVDRCGALLALLLPLAPLGCATADPTVTAAGSDDHFHWTTTTTAPPAAIWQRWTDVSSWPRWDDQVTSVSLPDGFVVGAVGALVPVGGDPARFVVTVVEPGRRAVFATDLPGGQLVVDRSLVVVPEGGDAGVTRFTHDVSFTGGSAWLFSRLLGGDYRRALPRVMAALAAEAEAGRAATDP